jgi:hypothetical protein
MVQRGVKKRFETLTYSDVSRALPPVFALCCTRPRHSITTSAPQAGLRADGRRVHTHDGWVFRIHSTSSLPHNGVGMRKPYESLSLTHSTLALRQSQRTLYTRKPNRHGHIWPGELPSRVNTQWRLTCRFPITVAGAAPELPIPDTWDKAHRLPVSPRPTNEVWGTYGGITPLQTERMCLSQ